LAAEGGHGQTKGIDGNVSSRVGRRVAGIGLGAGDAEQGADFALESDRDGIQGAKAGVEIGDNEIAGPVGPVGIVGQNSVDLGVAEGNGGGLRACENSLFMPMV
jgi:hypothetical protein